MAGNGGTLVCLVFVMSLWTWSKSSTSTARIAGRFGFLDLSGVLKFTKCRGTSCCLL